MKRSESLSQAKPQAEVDVVVEFHRQPLAARLPFILANQARIKNGYDLAFILYGMRTWFTTDDIVSGLSDDLSADECEAEIKRKKDMAERELMLQRKLFAEANSHVIKGGGELCEVLKKLAPEDRLALATICEALTKTTNDLVWVLKDLDFTHRQAFAETKKDLIKTTSDLIKVLKLMDYRGLPLAVTCQAVITNLCELGEVLSCFHYDDQVSFSAANIRLITNRQDLQLLLPYINRDRKDDFIREISAKLPDSVRYPLFHGAASIKEAATAEMAAATESDNSHAVTLSGRRH